MKRIQIVTLNAGLVGLCLMLAGSKLMAQAEGVNKGPVSMTASLVGSSTVSLGEPVLIKYVVKNSAEQLVSAFDQQSNGSPSITESLTEVGGTPLVPSVSRRLPHWKSETLSMEDGPNLTEMRKDESRSWQSLANSRIAFPHPGSYVLHIQVRMPCQLGDINQDAVNQNERSTLSADYVFPLKVIAAPLSYLHTVAEQLRKRIMQTTDVEARATLIEALFSMPEAAAASSWQSLVEEPKLDGATLSEITTALADQLTLRAADLLAEVAWNPLQPTSSLDEAMPGVHLDEMYDAGTPVLKKHIDELYKQHGIARQKYQLQWNN